MIVLLFMCGGRFFIRKCDIDDFIMTLELLVKLLKHFFDDIFIICYNRVFLGDFV